MAKNAERSRRGTSLQNFCDKAFERGFADVQAGRGFTAEYDARSKSWQWTYEAGRQFAAWLVGKGLNCTLRRQDGKLTVAALRYLPRAFANQKGAL